MCIHGGVVPSACLKLFFGPQVYWKYCSVLVDPSRSKKKTTKVIPTAQLRNLHANSSTYMSLSDNRGPESVYQSLQSSAITADPQYSNERH